MERSALQPLFDVDRQMTTDLDAVIELKSEDVQRVLDFWESAPEVYEHNTKLPRCLYIDKDNYLVILQILRRQAQQQTQGELLEAAMAAEKLMSATLAQPDANPRHPIHALRAAIAKAKNNLPATN